MISRLEVTLAKLPCWDHVVSWDTVPRARDSRVGRWPIRTVVVSNAIISTDDESEKPHILDRNGQHPLEVSLELYPSLFLYSPYTLPIVRTPINIAFSTAGFGAIGTPQLQHKIVAYVERQNISTLNRRTCWNWGLICSIPSSGRIIKFPVSIFSRAPSTQDRAWKIFVAEKSAIKLHYLVQPTVRTRGNIYA